MKSYTANLGPIQYGSKRNCLIKLSAPPGVETLCTVKVKYGPTSRQST